MRRELVVGWCAVGILLQHACVLNAQAPPPPLELVGRARVSAVYDVEVVPPYAYALERGILRVLDIRHPEHVAEVASLELRRPYAETVLRYPYLYLTGFFQTLGVVDIADPIRPRWIGEVPAVSETLNWGTALARDFLYVLRRKGPGSEYGGYFSATDPRAQLVLEIVSLANPASPTSVARLELGVPALNGGAGHIAHSDNHVYVRASGTPRNRLFIVNTSTPARPVLERTVLLPEGRRLGDLAVRGDLVFMLQYRPAAGIVVFRLGPGEEPEFLGEAVDPRLQIPVELSLRGDVAFATFKGAVDVATFDVSDPGHPRLIHTYTIDSNRWAAGLCMTLVDNRLYVAGDGGPTPIFDVADPRAPRLLGRWEFEGGWVGDVLRTGDLAILTQVGGGVVIYDVGTPGAARRLARSQAAPASVGAESWQSNVAAGASGSRVLIAYETIPAEVLDITDPTHPSVMGHFVPRGLVQAIALSPSHAILGYRNASNWWEAAAGGGIEIVGLADVSRVDRVSTLDLGQAVTDVALHGGRLLAAHPGAGVTMIDVRDATRPSVLGRLQGTRSPDERSMGRGTRVVLDADGDFAYVVSRDIPTMEGAPGNAYFGHGTLSVVDLRDTAGMRVVGRIDFERKNIWDISVTRHRDDVYIFAGDILVVDVTEPTAPRVKLRQPFPPTMDWIGESVGLTVDDEYLYLGAAEDGLWIYRLPSAERRPP